jgi:hypothetical protein
VRQKEELFALILKRNELVETMKVKIAIKRESKVHQAAHTQEGNEAVVWSGLQAATNRCGYFQIYQPHINRVRRMMNQECRENIFVSWRVAFNMTFRANLGAAASLGSGGDHH